MRVVSFFAGCGGLDLGFEQAGFDVVWANEFEPHCRATYLRNHPDTEFLLGDICKIDPASIPDCDGFIFEGTDIKAQYKMIGNAVPPRLGNVLAKSSLLHSPTYNPRKGSAIQRLLCNRASAMPASWLATAKARTTNDLSSKTPSTTCEAMAVRDRCSRKIAPSSPSTCSCTTRTMPRSTSWMARSQYLPMPLSLPHLGSMSPARRTSVSASRTRRASTSALPFTTSAPTHHYSQH